MGASDLYLHQAALPKTPRPPGFSSCLSLLELPQQSARVQKPFSIPRSACRTLSPCLALRAGGGRQKTTKMPKAKHADIRHAER